MTTLRPVVFDIECFGNYFLAAFKEGNRKPFLIEMVGEDSVLNEYDMQRLRIIFNKDDICLYGFNSNKYDVPLIAMAMSGATAKECRRFSDYLIQRVGGRGDTVKPSDAMTKWKVKPIFPKHHIDMIEIAPGIASLKMYAARCGHKKIQDMPVSGAKSILTDDEITMVRDYCGNDLDMTESLRKALAKNIDVRFEIAKRYYDGRAVLSKSDAQIAEWLFKKGLGLDTVDRKHIIERADWKTEMTYTSPDWIDFDGLTDKDTLNDFLRIANTEKFEMLRGKIKAPQSMLDKNLPMIRGISYKVGVGGLHSMRRGNSFNFTEKNKHTTDANKQILVEYDVASYYPSIILKLGLAPKQFNKAKFLKFYRAMVDDRLKAKADGDKATDAVLKIAINGSFGKFGSQYSILQAPEMMLAVTMTGQFALLELIARIGDISGGVSVVAANTDGVLVDTTRDELDNLKEVISQWETKTGFTGETSYWNEYWEESVNSYLLVGDNEIKRKGTFGKPSLAKNPHAKVLTDALILWRTKGVDPVKYISGEADVHPVLSDYYFVQGVNTRRDGPETLPYGASWKGQRLGRVARWVWAEGGEPIYDLATKRKVAKSDDAIPIMDQGNLPHRLKLKHWKYVVEFKKLMERCGMPYGEDKLL